MKDVNFGVLDCNAQLPSKKTTMQRLKLEKKKPVMFYSAYGRKPRQLQPKLLSSEYSLVRELRALGMMHAVKVKDTMHLQEACLSRAACGLVLTTSGNVDDTSLETLNALSDEFSSMNWVVVDASKLRLKSPSEKELGLPKFDSSGHRLILFTEKGESHAATSEEDDEMSNRLATPYLGPFTAEKAASFVRDVLGEQTERKPASVGIFGGELRAATPRVVLCPLGCLGLPQAGLHGARAATAASRVAPLRQLLCISRSGPCRASFGPPPCTPPRSTARARAHPRAMRFHTQATSRSRRERSPRRPRRRRNRRLRRVRSQRGAACRTETANEPSEARRL